MTRNTPAQFLGQLESLRGVAATIVVFYHSPFVNEEKWSLIQAGDIFVDFFFVLSGFVMTLAYSRKVQDGFGFYQFTLLRFARLYPLHIFLLMVWVLYIFAKAQASSALNVPFEWSTEIGLVAFVYNTLLLQGMGVMDSLSWNAPSWSISVEFFAYIAFFVFFRIVHARAGLIALSVSIFSYAFVLFVPGEKSAEDILVTYDYGILRCLGGFFFGVFVQMVFTDFPPIKLNRGSTNVAQVVLVAIVGVCIAASHENTLLQLVCIALFGILIAFFATTDGVVTNFLNTTPMRFLGKISYSIYLVHAIVLTVALNVIEFVLKWDVTLAPGTTNKVVNTAYAAPINCALFVVVLILSYFTWKYIEKVGQKVGRKLSST